MTRRTILVAAAVLIVALGVAAYFLFRKAPVLTAVTWAGSYGRAQASALFVPYGQSHRVDVRIAEYDGGLGELRRQVNAKQVGWDVVDMELPDAIAACREGLLEPVDATKLPAGANGATAATDFVPNAVGKCWVGSVVYSQVIAFAPNRFGDARPIAASDFFDLARFPGPRALRRSSAKLNLELALLADGVTADKVYSLLATREGVERALKKLDTIKSAIVWWDRSSEPIAMLEDGRAAFATALNGDIYDAAMHHHPLGVVWDAQLYELDVFAIPKGDPKREMAEDFVRFATGAEALARVAGWVPYGPARRSAVPLVGRNPELGTEMRPFLPTSPDHFATAFAVDDAWWQAHGAEISPRWQAWVAR
jgi:putative spermidine/putrescine transport system substrate-binding protein